MNRQSPGTTAVIIVLLGLPLVIGTPALAQDRSVGEPGRSSGQPNPLKNVYFGEQHMHTENSFDAFTIGSGTWEDAYRYAQGETIKHPTTGAEIKKVTPYDFVAITDHSEYYGVLKDLVNPDSPLSKSEFAKGFAEGMKDPTGGGAKYVTELIGTLLANQPMEEYNTPELRVGNWAKFVETADQYYKPGEFTTLYAYEWTSIPNGQNMHRNVFFREQPPVVPFSSFDSQLPQDLWTYLESQRAMGIDTFAIPHNANVSDGWMFSPMMPTSVNTTFQGEPMNERYARRQQENEPLFEMAQIKGSSEAHPILSPNDEFANFELYPALINIGMPGQLKHGFYRQALGDGFRIEQALGYNPYKMGVVAGADFHSGYQGNEEFNFEGGHGTIDDTPEKRLSPKVQASGVKGPIVSSAGTTAVWATENTREGIFDGMLSKETYGTSGTLIRLRFFGGWGYSDDLTDDADFVKEAYDGGVPMGGDLPEKPAAAKAPTFAVWALKDPESGNLDRIQIIKVYLDPRLGRSVEAIYNVALADLRTVDEDGNAPPVGNTVDLKTATYTNDIGDTQLAAVWTDPDFDPTGKAAYYVRVMEIPTPRWSTYDSVRNNLPLTDIVPPTIQERAWSSPIWYTPSK